MANRGSVRTEKVLAVDFQDFWPLVLWETTPVANVRADDLGPSENDETTSEAAFVAHC